MPRKHDDLSGSVVGRWTLAHRAPDHGRTIYYLCRCACGVERDVALPSLMRGASTSCGLCRGDMAPVPCPYLPNPEPQDCPTTAHGAPIRHSGECHTDQAVAPILN